MTRIWKMKGVYDRTLRRIPPVHNSVRASLWHLSSLLLSFGSKITRFELPPEDVAPYFRIPMLLGHYERGLVALYRSLLRPGMVVVDVGAHAGYHTLRFAHLVGPAGKVIAFEPSPVTFGILSRNVHRRGLSNVILEQKAVTSRTGQILVYRGENSMDVSAVVRSQGRSPLLVDCVSLGDYLDKCGLGRVNLIKVDVEGAEVDALAGMQWQCSANPWLITEFYPKRLEAAGNPPSRLLNLLFDLGFEVHEIKENGILVPLDTYAHVDDFVSSVSKLTNLFAQRKRAR